ncbi:hypothetical protein V8C42DRAFT_314740 [Trichoderma barbatum]
MRRYDGKLLGPDKRPLTEVTRDELLWFLRTEHEGAHRSNIAYPAVIYSYSASARDAAAGCLPDMPKHHWVDTCNKSVPIYIIPSGRWLLLRVVLHNYIYRRWFRPYRSEIDFHRFICRFINPYDIYNELSTVSMATIHDIISLNQAICTKVEAQRSGFMDQYMRCVSVGEKESGPDGGTPDHRILQPLFRALLIVVSDEKYNKETSKTVGSLPVHLVRTGIEEGLSAPISFKPIAAKIYRHIEPGRVIEVTIETAIDFVMGLEAREVAAFGLRPDPITDWKPFDYMIKDWQSRGETEPLVGPNSQWVDTKKYPRWTGAGMEDDSRFLTLLEERQFMYEAGRESRERSFLEAQRAAAISASESTAVCDSGYHG